MIRAIAIAIVMLTALAQADGLAPRENARIEYLIFSIASLRDAQFIRNGTAYGAAAAADHLRLKLDKAGARVRTAEDFIRVCASESSMSGKPYEIRFADGRVVLSGTFLKQKLTEYDDRHPT